MTALGALEVLGAPLEGVNLIEASAGTGKTWTICGLYLRLLLEKHLTVQEILVVTFTNAATAELRERIRTRLLEMQAFLSDGDGEPDTAPDAGPATAGRPAPGRAAADPFVTELARRLLGRQSPTRGELRQRLALALHSFDEASIFTIHGFCQRALADNPFAAGLPLQSELVASDHPLLMEAVHDFWRRHVAHESVAPAFARYLVARKDSPKKYAALLERHLSKPLARHLWPQNLHDPPFEASQLLAPYRAARSMWLAHRAEICALLTNSLGALDGKCYKPQTLADAAAHWDALCADDDPQAVPGERAGLFRSGTLAGCKRKNGIPPTHAFFAQAERYLSLREEFAASLVRARCRLLERLFDEAGERLRSLKRSRQVVSFGDLLSNVHERLHHAAHPWLAAALRTRFPAALIDEFQDTDPLQLAIFEKIYATPGATVFLVGDPKQAIYSFRHADLHSYLRAARGAARTWSLQSNQRSSEPLLSALNGLFGANAQAFVLPEVRYRETEYGRKPRPPFEDRSATRAPLQVWRLPDGDGAGLPKADARRAAVEATAAEIARLVQAGEDGLIRLDGRSLRPADIAVLVRSRAFGVEVKEALRALRVGAVELSHDSIFASPEAADLATVLTAIVTPTRDGLLRTALATLLLGCDAAQIERIVASDTQLPDWMARFVAYRELWRNRGFGVMIRQLFADNTVADRLLARPDGERRMTNLLHLAELLQAADTQASPEALLRTLQAASAEQEVPDESQLRLESDRNLVQIVTIHACKGLEYPIVFCPFLCDGYQPSKRAIEGREYHDEQLLPVIDFRSFDDKDPALRSIKTLMATEQAAETVRLLYVALTRAVHRCYLVAGPYATPQNRKEGACSMLNWLVAGDGQGFDQWRTRALSTALLDAAWQRLAQARPHAIAIDALPRAAGIPVRPPATDGDVLATPAPPRYIAAGWRLSSYSGLSHGVRSEQAAGDHDARVGAAHGAEPDTAGRGAGIAETEVAADDILRFPRGAGAGDCIHAVFEAIDFTDSGCWQPAVGAALAAHAPARAAAAAALPTAMLARMLRNLIGDVTATELRPGLRLDSIPLRRRLTELEFNFPVPHLAATALNATLARLGYDVPPLTFGSLEGYLKGFIDLVFEHEGRFFILDWKSNHLGRGVADYGPEPLARAMAEHGYHLQLLLYTLALHRYLRFRLPGYRYEDHVGGVLYLFVRGVRPGWHGADGTPAGVYFHRPGVGTVQTLDALFGAAAPGAAAAAGFTGP